MRSGFIVPLCSLPVACRHLCLLYWQVEEQPEEESVVRTFNVVKERFLEMLKVLWRYEGCEDTISFL